jgi:hypothetical protein
VKLPEWTPFAAGGVALGAFAAILVVREKNVAIATAAAARISNAVNCLASWQDQTFVQNYGAYNSILYNVIPTSVYTGCGFTAAETAAIKAGTSTLVAKQEWTDTGPDFNHGATPAVVSIWTMFVKALISA